MLKEKKTQKLYYIVFGILLLAIIGVAVWGLTHTPRKEPYVPPAPTPEVVIREKEVEKVVEVEKEITAEILQDGLRDMGLLVTEEYYFTDVITFSSIKKVFNMELSVTESSYMAGYDGVVTAGIDFSSAQIRKDDEAGRIIITLPAAEIIGVDIDPESFVLYDERIRPWNPISAEDYNNSLLQLEQQAREKALGRGILEKADKNARALVKNLIAGLVDSSRYTVEFSEG